MSARGARAIPPPPAWPAEPLVASVTLNPAVDEALEVERLTTGTINRCRLVSLDPGGKGLNASRVVQRLGRPTRALGFVGGVTGQMIRAWLDAEGVPHDFIEVDDLTRLDVILYETASGQSTRLYPPGARVDPDLLPVLRDHLAGLTPGSVVVLAGSLPPGLGPEVYRDLTAWLNGRELRVVLDAQGAALGAALEAGPWLVKPNVEEAQDLLGRALPDDAAVLAAALELHDRGAQHVVISQGAAGAIGVGAAGCWKAIPPRIEAKSAVGSGDSMVAGLALGLLSGHPLDEALRLGTATGAGTAHTPGTQLCHPADVERFLPLVTITRLPAAMPERSSRGAGVRRRAELALQIRHGGVEQ